MGAATASVLLLLATACAALHHGAAVGYWGADNRVVQGYTDSQGRHYPRLPGPLLDYFNAADGDVSNQISRHQDVPAVPYTRHNRWRHRPALGERSEEAGAGGRGRGRGRRRGRGGNGGQWAAAHGGGNSSAGGGGGGRRQWSGGVWKTSQWGAVRIPHRGAVVNVPVLEGSRKAYRGSITTSVEPPPPGRVSLRAVSPSAAPPPPLQRRPRPPFAVASQEEVRDAPAGPPPPQPQPQPQPLAALPCVRCPGDRAVVAARGRHLVLLEQPEVRPCPDGPRFKLPDLKMEWIQGPKPGSLVQEGHHIMVGRLSYRDRVLQTCRMKLNVLVRKCPPLMLPKHMTVQCTLGNSWGSRCQFSCNNGLRVSGQASAECNDDLSWSHPVPVCEALKGCPAPMSPPHGQLLCQAHMEEAWSQVLPENTKCEYVCNPGYDLPATHYHLATILCRDGAWNSTVDPMCINISGIAVDHPNAIQREQPHKRRRHKLRSGIHKRSHNDPCNPNPCKEGGTCLRGPKVAPAMCVCPDHREGDFCEHERCKEKCENGGQCVIFDDKAVCYCPPGYRGDHCEEMDSR